MKHNPDAFPPVHWKFRDAADVERWDCPPLEWLIDGLVAVGSLVLIAAPSQTGKSLFALQLSSVLATGGRLFDQYPARVSNVLYFALEDPEHRVRDRLLDISEGLPGKKLVGGKGGFEFYFAPGFNLSCYRHFGHLEELIEKAGFDVIVLDTYQRATPGLVSYDDKDQSVILHHLSNLTRKHRVTIFVIDHLRKAPNQARSPRQSSMEDIKGTGGKVQNADVVVLLERQRGSREMAFRCYSKDADAPVQILLKVSGRGERKPKFTYAGDLTATVMKRGHQTQDQVLRACRAAGGPVGTSEVANATRLPESTVRKKLNALLDSGDLTRTGVGRSTRYTVAEAVPPVAPDPIPRK